MITDTSTNRSMNGNSALSIDSTRILVTRINLTIGIGITKSVGSAGTDSPIAYYTTFSIGTTRIGLARISC